MTTIESAWRETVEPVEGLDRRLRLALGGAEGREVVLAEGELCGGMHGIGIERHRDVPDAVILERRARAAVEDAELVVPRRRAEARLETLVDRRRH